MVSAAVFVSQTLAPSQPCLSKNSGGMLHHDFDLVCRRMIAVGAPKESQQNNP